MILKTKYYDEFVQFKYTIFKIRILFAIYFYSIFYLLRGERELPIENSSRIKMHRIIRRMFEPRQILEKGKLAETCKIQRLGFEAEEIGPAIRNGGRLRVSGKKRRKDKRSHLAHWISHYLDSASVSAEVMHPGIAR